MSAAPASAALPAAHDDEVGITNDRGGPGVSAIREAGVAAGVAITGAARAGDARAALEALGGFRLLCAHRRGPYGVATWSARVEAWLASAVPGFAATGAWYVGRPLLVTENDYTLGLYNGDTGVVVAAGGGRALGGVVARGRHPPGRPPPPPRAADA